MTVAEFNKNFWPLRRLGRKSLVGLRMRGRDCFLIDWSHRGRQGNEQEETEITEKSAALEAAGLPLCFLCCLLLNAGRWLRTLPQQVGKPWHQPWRILGVAGDGLGIGEVSVGIGQGRLRSVQTYIQATMYQVLVQWERGRRWKPT
jgi:hypothetical protein